MSSEPHKPAYPDRLQGEGLGKRRGQSGDVDDAVAPAAVTPKPNNPPSEEDEIEAGFDNMPI